MLEILSQHHPIAFVKKLTSGRAADGVNQQIYPSLDLASNVELLL